MATATTTEAIATQVGRINPLTGHMFTANDAAQAHAAGPDQPDPPAIGRSFTFAPARGFPPPGHAVPRRPQTVGGGRFPGGGGPPGGGGGFPGGGFPIPGGPAPGQPLGGIPNDKLIGNAPPTYNGDPKKAKEFLSAWKLYQRVNRGVSQMDNMYK